MHVPHSALNGRHLHSALCRKGADRRQQREALSDARRATTDAQLSLDDANRRAERLQVQVDCERARIDTAQAEGRETDARLSAELAELRAAMEAKTRDAAHALTLQLESHRTAMQATENSHAAEQSRLE